MGAVYLPEQAGLDNLIGQFFAMLIFTGFIVVVAFELLRKCFITSNSPKGTVLFVLFSVLLPASYYVVSVISAHSDGVVALIYFFIWLSIVGLLGCLIQGKLPSNSTIRFTLSFALTGVLVFTLTSIGWSYIYGSFVRPSYLSLTPYITFGGSVIVWVVLLAIVLLLGRRSRYVLP